jgi:hypothetical protein
MLMTDMNADQSPTTLRSSRLTVEIAAPGSVYAGTRFDWTGFVTQVTLDRQHTFCMPESLTPGQGSGGIGLCGEFGIDKAIGYHDVSPGEGFPKLGIGLLKRPDGERYDFFRPHEIVQTFPIQVAATETQARFVVDPIDCRGYAVRLTKTLSVDGNWLKVSYRLDNVGSNHISTNEYCHNFMGIDQQPIGPDYRLRFPYQVELQLPPHMPPQPILSVSGNDLTLNGTPQRPFYCRPLGFSQTEEPQWELFHLPSGVGLREYDDFAPMRVAVWGTAHVISAEIFVDIALQPGETQTWMRRYMFFKS